MLSQQFSRVRRRRFCTKCGFILTNGTCHCEYISPTACGSPQQNTRTRSPYQPHLGNASASNRHVGFSNPLNIPRPISRGGDSYSMVCEKSSNSFSSTCLDRETNARSEEVRHLSSLNVHSSTNTKGLMGCFQMQSDRISMDETQCTDRKSGSLPCSVCADLRGALLCRQCGLRGSGFEHSYRTSYMYKSLDVGLRAFGTLRKLFTAGGHLRTSFSPTNVVAGGRIHSAASTSGRLGDEPSPPYTDVNSRNLCQVSQIQLGPINSTERAAAHQQQPTLQDTDWQMTHRLSPREPEQAHLKQLEEEDHAGRSFWVGVNRVEETVVTLARQQPLLIWTLWSVLSVGFFCGLNCILWPFLALLFLLRQLRILAWETAVRRLSSNVFSADLEAQLVNHNNGAADRTQISESRRPQRATEILSLMESQEKLFFSMPWMAVTAFSYCERLTLPELCTAITHNLLQPKEEFRDRFRLSGDSNSLEHLPLSAFQHPRLLTRVQRVMKRFCWVRQENFQVSQHVIKLTKKGIDLLRQQQLEAHMNSRGRHFTDGTGGSSAQVEGLCTCVSVGECDCLIDESDVIYLVNEALSQPLDPQKPLWQFLLLENALFPSSVADNSSGKRLGSAVIFRMHHAVGDGISITRMFLRDFLRTAPAIASTTDRLKANIQTQAPENLGAQREKKSGDNEKAFVHRIDLRYSADGPEEAKSPISTSISGSTLSHASTSTTWEPFDASTNSTNEGSNPMEKAPSSAQAESISRSATLGVSPLKASVSVCKIPDGIFWRLLVAIRFALQLPFYAAAMALLLRCEALGGARRGSARRTRIAHPICFPLNHLKDLKNKLIITLTERSAGHCIAEKNFRLKPLSSWFSASGRAGQPQPMHQRNLLQGPRVVGNQEGVPRSRAPHSRATGSRSYENDCKGGGTTLNSVRITLNDVLAACIVGGYHRYAALARAELSSGRRGIDDRTQAPETCCWKEDINFIVPVNLRRRDEDAKDLRNRFASLVIQMPISSKGDSLERLRGVHIAMRRTLHSFALPMVMLLERWLYATWPDLLMVFFLLLTRKISVIFSSVIGPASLPYVQNSRVHGMNFVVPQPGEVGVGVSAFSCGETLSMCISADETVVKNPGVLRKCIIAEYKALCRACTDFLPLKL